MVVDRALGAARGPGGVDEHEGVHAFHLLRRRGGAGKGGEVHLLLKGEAEAADHGHLLRPRHGPGLPGLGEELHPASPAEEAVLDDEELSFGVLEAEGGGLRPVAREDGDGDPPEVGHGEEGQGRLEAHGKP